MIDVSEYELPRRFCGLAAPEFPARRKQHGEQHWPVLKAAVFTTAQGGLALQPSGMIP